MDENGIEISRSQLPAPQSENSQLTTPAPVQWPMIPAEPDPALIEQLTILAEANTTVPIQQPFTPTHSTNPIDPFNPTPATCYDTLTPGPEELAQPRGNDGSIGDTMVWPDVIDQLEMDSSVEEVWPSDNGSVTDSALGAESSTTAGSQIDYAGWSKGVQEIHK